MIHRISQGNRNIEEALTSRSIGVGILFAIISAYINTYLGLNFGLGLNIGTVALITAFVLFKRSSKALSKGELTTIYIISTSLLTSFWTLGAAIYIVEMYPEASVPHWLAPSKDLIVSRSVPLSHWLLPSVTILTLEVLSGLAGLLIGAYIASGFISDKKLTFPRVVATLAIIEACTSEGALSHLLWISLAIGSGVTVFQYLLQHVLKINTIFLDFTPYLPQGISLGISISIGIISLGYIIGSRAALSILMSSIISYALVSPMLVNYNLMKPARNIASAYNQMLYKFLLPSAIGMLIAGGMVSSLSFLVRRLTLRGRMTMVFRRRDIGTLYSLIPIMVLYTTLCLLAFILNPFSPFPPWFSIIFVVYSILMASTLEIPTFTRSLGEVGMGVSSLAIMLYDVPLFLLGYRGYTGYIMGGYFRPAPWIAAGLVGFLKYKESFEVRLEDIIRSRVIGWIVTSIISLISTIMLWSYFDFTSSVMPAIGLLQLGTYYRMFATGNLEYLGPFAVQGLSLGCIIGGILEKFPILSSMGMAIGLLLPPQYSLALGIGGIIRLVTEKHYGAESFTRVGIIISSGLMISAFLTEMVIQALLIIS